MWKFTPALPRVQYLYHIVSIKITCGVYVYVQKLEYLYGSRIEDACYDRLLLKRLDSGRPDFRDAMVRWMLQFIFDSSRERWVLNMYSISFFSSHDCFCLKWKSYTAAFLHHIGMFIFSWFREFSTQRLYDINITNSCIAMSVNAAHYFVKIHSPSKYSEFIINNWEAERNGTFLENIISRLQQQT